MSTAVSWPESDAAKCGAGVFVRERIAGLAGVRSDALGARAADRCTGRTTRRSAGVGGLRSWTAAETTADTKNCSFTSVSPTRPHADEPAGPNFSCRRQRGPGPANAQGVGVRKMAYASADAMTCPSPISYETTAGSTPTPASIVRPKDAKLVAGVMSPPGAALPVLESIDRAP